MASTLIVEDGTVVAGAHSYVTLAEAAAYHTMYGNTGWVGTDAVLDQALLIACRSLELLYGPRYLSQRLTNGQPLMFPRYAFYDNLMELHAQSSIPQRLKDAQCEIALLYLTGSNVFPEDNPASGVVQESVRVGEIQTSTTYSKQPTKASFDGFRKIDITLYPLLKLKNPVLAFSR